MARGEKSRSSERWAPRVSHAENAFDPDFDIRGDRQTHDRRAALLERQHEERRRQRNYPGFDSPWTAQYEDSYEDSREDESTRRRPSQAMLGGEDSAYPGSSWSYAENEWYMRPEGGRNFYGKGPKGWRRTDDRIKEDVCEALYQSWEVDATDIDVSVENGHVYLKGEVSDRRTKRRAEEMVEFISGVEDVINELRIVS
jgi:hypothetical protein